MKRLVLSICALVLWATWAAGVAAAGPLDKRTNFTFNAPVAVPGVTLPAGSYVFRLAHDTRGRDIVQVLSAEGTPYAMFHSLRTLRSEPADKPEVRFLETAADMPAAVQSWWYPADTQGYEFVYPREQARLLAKGSGRSVLTTEADEFIWVAPEEPVVAAPEPVLAAEEPVLVGEVAAAEESAPAFEAQEPAPAELPRTDSPTATLILVGFLSLLAVAGLRLGRAARA